MPEMRLDEVEGAIAAGALRRDPHAVYRTLRTEQPVYWSSTLGQWLVTSYELVEQVLLSPREYSSYGFDTSYINKLDPAARDRVPTLIHHFQQRGLIQADPPEHTRLRRAVRSSFTNHAVARLEPTVRAVLGRLLPDGDRTFDLVSEVAGPLPVAVIAELLGVPVEHRSAFPVWSQHAVEFFGTTTPVPENALRLDETLIAWRDLLAALLRDKAASPRDDFLSLLAARAAASEITHEEAIFTAVHLLIAGHETTTSLVVNTTFHLLSRPELWARVVAHPGLVANAVEETLRFEPPIQRVRRSAAIDTSLGGMRIRAGDPVIPVLSSANRDQAVFPDPDSYRIDREFDRPHLAFGRGVHFCLGAPLARLEAPIALAALVERYPTAALPAGFAPEWIPTINLRRVQALPVQPR